MEPKLENHLLIELMAIISVLKILVLSSVITHTCGICRIFYGGCFTIILLSRVFIHKYEQRQSERLCEREESLSFVKARKQDLFCFFPWYRGYPTLTTGFPWHVCTRNPCQRQFTRLCHYLLPAVPGQVSMPACIPHSQHIKSWDLLISFSVFR